MPVLDFAALANTRFILRIAFSCAALKFSLNKHKSVCLLQFLRGL
jgi:hypothetical protein